MRTSLRLAICLLYFTSGIISGFSPGLLSQNIYASVPSPDANVILVTLDGVRWNEVFIGPDPELAPPDPQSKPGSLFPFLTTELKTEGFLTGDLRRGEQASASTPTFISLPAYQSIMAGALQDCRSNSCGRIKVETLAERLVRESGFQKKQVATIASWSRIALAVEHTENTTFVNAGPDPLFDSDGDPQLTQLNKDQAAELPPWGDARADRFTFAQAIRYLKKHQPRFLFISLNDADEWAHKGNYPNYLSTLKQYDLWLKTLVSTLDGLGSYGKSTTLLVTTDHGRGEKKEWNDHGSGYPTSKDIWFYGRSPRTRSHVVSKGLKSDSKSAASALSHLDIRPTIEKIFGLSLHPAPSAKPIEAVLP